MLSEDAGSDRCGDVLILGDDYGDNECSFCCTLEAGHDEPHRDEFEYAGGLLVAVTWHAKEDNIRGREASDPCRTPSGAIIALHRRYRRC